MRIFLWIFFLDLKPIKRGFRNAGTSDAINLDRQFHTHPRGTQSKDKKNRTRQNKNTNSINSHFMSISTDVLKTVVSKLDVSHVNSVWTSTLLRASIVRLLFVTSKPVSLSLLDQEVVVRGRSLRYHVTRGRGLPADNWIDV